MKSKSKNVIPITYEELGDYIGRKTLVLVSQDWLESIKSATEVTKQCSKCEEDLPLDFFNNDKRRQFGKRSQCKSCYKEANPSSTKLVEDSPKIEYVLTDFNA
jgi:bacterioferritin-associated ferredoxin